MNEGVMVHRDAVHISVISTTWLSTLYDKAMEDGRYWNDNFPIKTDLHKCIFIWCNQLVISTPLTIRDFLLFNWELCLYFDVVFTPKAVVVFIVFMVEDFCLYFRWNISLNNLCTCLFLFDLRILIIPLISSNSSCK